jgi:hypothetical protein
MQRSLWLSAFILLAAVPLTINQQTSARKGAFETVIKQATGKNGYEELVMAADILQNSPAWKRLQADPNATLTLKREVLRDPQVMQALRMVDQGLQKPVSSPREKANFDMALPELGEFRALGRLVATQQYVLLADGRVSDALANARVGLKLGLAVQTDTMLSGVIGVYIGTTCIQPIGAHLDQLSARDLDTLYSMCLEWLRLPSPEMRMVEVERRNALTSLDALRGQSLEKLIASTNLDPKPKPDDDDSIRRGRQLAADLRVYATQATGGSVDQLYVDAAKRLDDHYGKVLEQFRLPLWQRHFLELPDDGSLAGRLASQLVPTVTGIGDAYARDQAKIRVLACHAAVLRYRWEHNKVPATLADANVGELALDPFTGQSLEYQPLGFRYRLVSVGPATAPDNPRAVNGRLPVSVTPGD